MTEIEKPKMVEKIKAPCPNCREEIELIPCIKKRCSKCGIVVAIHQHPADKAHKYQLKRK